MAEATVMRLLTFRPGGDDSVVDSVLRSALAASGVESMSVGTYVGRRGPDEEGQHVVVSLWPSREAMLAALGAEAEVRPCGWEATVGFSDARLEILPLALSLSFETNQPSRIVRVYRGTTKPGEFDAYVEDVRSDTVADAAADRGPHALHLAVEAPRSFVTVSVWSEWSQIEAAEGGSIRRPIATKHEHRLEAGTAVHYELLPSRPDDDPATGTD